MNRTDIRSIITASSGVINAAEYVASGTYYSEVARMRLTPQSAGTNNATIAEQNWKIFHEMCLAAVGGSYNDGTSGAVYVGGSGSNVWSLKLPGAVSDWSMPGYLAVFNDSGSETDGKFECWDMAFGWDVAQGSANTSRHRIMVDGLRIMRLGTVSGPVLKLHSQNPASNGYMEAARIGSVRLSAGTTGGAVNNGLSVIGGIGHSYGEVHIDLNGNTGWGANFEGYWTGAAYVVGTTHTVCGNIYARESRGVRIANNSLVGARLTVEDCTGGLFIGSNAGPIQFQHLYFESNAAYEGAAKTITNAANNGAGLIRITSAAHGLATGDRVRIAAVGGTTEANADWDVTYVDANNVDLQGSTFTNAYTAGGTMKWLQDSEIVSGAYDPDLQGTYTRPYCIGADSITTSGGRRNCVRIQRANPVRLEAIYAPDLTGNIVIVNRQAAFAVAGVYSSSLLRPDGSTTGDITSNEAAFVDIG